MQRIFFFVAGYSRLATLVLADQIVLNNIMGGPDFACGRMIWLSGSFPPFPVSKLSLFLGLPVCHRSSLLTGEGGS